MHRVTARHVLHCQRLSRRAPRISTGSQRQVSSQRRQQSSNNTALHARHARTHCASNFNFVWLHSELQFMHSRATVHTCKAVFSLPRGEAEADTSSHDSHLSAVTGSALGLVPHQVSHDVTASIISVYFYTTRIHSVHRGMIDFKCLH